MLSAWSKPSFEAARMDLVWKVGNVSNRVQSNVMRTSLLAIIDEKDDFE